MSLKSREDFPTVKAYLEYLIELKGSKTAISTVQMRWSSKGIRDPDKLVAPPMSKEQRGRIGAKKAVKKGYNQGSLAKRTI